LIAANHDFLHAREVVSAFDGLNAKLSISGFFDLPVFPDDHGRHGLIAHRIGNIEPFNAPRGAFKTQEPFQLVHRLPFDFLIA